MKVQIIDDSLFARKTVRRYLSDIITDIEFIESSSGNLGMQHFSEQKPDLVTLDLLMDDVHGTDVLKHIRADSSDCFVTVVSSDIQKTMQETVYGLGANLFIGKPFTPELAHKIWDAYQNHKAGFTNAPEIGPGQS